MGRWTKGSRLLLLPAWHSPSSPQACADPPLLMPPPAPGSQVRRRDSGSKKVVVEECRYDTTGEAGTRHCS